jgi:hypothetical protein
MSHIEYVGYFVTLAQRSLSPDDYKLFRFVYLLGADWKLCNSSLVSSGMTSSAQSAGLKP